MGGHTLFAHTCQPKISLPRSALSTRNRLNRSPCRMKTNDLHAAPAVGADVCTHTQRILNALDGRAGDNMTIQTCDGFAAHQLHLHRALNSSADSLTAFDRFTRLARSACLLGRRLSEPPLHAWIHTMSHLDRATICNCSKFFTCG